MASYFARRLLLMIPTFIGVTVIVFGITRLVPGGPVEKELMAIQSALAGGEGGAGTTMVGTELITDKLRKQLEQSFYLDKPFYEAYLLWLGDVVRLDLGESFATKEPVWTRIKERFPISLTFGLTGFILSYLICIPLGIAKALRHAGVFDLATSIVVFVGYSIPGWAIGLLLLVFLAGDKYWDVFPLGGTHSDTFASLPGLAQLIEDPDVVVDANGELVREKMSLAARFLDRTYYMILPIFCYMMGSFATLTILTKNSLLDNLSQDYVRTAFAKGLAPMRVIFLHTLRNSLIPLATGLGHALSVLMAGSLLIEQIFNIPGIGLLGYNALVGFDFTVVMGVLAINTVLLMFGNVFSDMLYALIDPRIRFE
ncbi:MAG: ABC transporter permease subunit [Planctomycetota bacterium]|nr:MAG: ABC transporter permease subunit [Planctomycetota bacterium]REK25750.1 MAG: ABC transporter permease subunit [Planctomycetota bacterium]REK46502.1 MAG: ABC transporter permease subunit [Planctomycetota bacterium]